MKYLLCLFCIFILFYFNCEVSGFKDVSQASASSAASASETVHTIKDAIDIKKELDIIRKGRGKKRARRYSDVTENEIDPTLNKFTAGIGALLKTYVYQPIAHGNFLETTIRSYNMWNSAEGKFVFGTLDGELNQSFRSIMKDRRPRTGDIIACRIPDSRMAEHYMMVINNKIAEVGVVGGKTTHNGVIILDSYKKSSYINSTECLYHENRIISRAEQIDEKNGNDSEVDLRYQQILERVQCTATGTKQGQFRYSIMACNCQDFVLYWAYGYTENHCLEQFECSPHSNLLLHITDYVDESGSFKKQREQNQGDFTRFTGVVTK